MQESYINIILILHASCGFVALGSGLGAIIFKKGSRNHNQAGRLYFYTMIGVIITAFIVSVCKDNDFLFLVGVFTAYMLYSGYRAIQHKKITPSKLDWVSVVIAIICGVYMISTVDTILIGFGILILFLAQSDCKVFINSLRGKSDKKAWLIKHVRMMLGGYIATFTAFAVTVISYRDYAWIVWLGPSIVFTPVILFWLRRIRLGKMELIGKS